MGDLMLLLGKGKKKGAPGADESSDDMSGDSPEDAETSYAREAYGALKDNDEDGFVTAFLGAVRACAGKAKGGGYEDEESEEA